MPKVLVLMAPGHHVMRDIWRFSGHFLAERDGITCWVLPAEYTGLALAVKQV